MKDIVIKNLRVNYDNKKIINRLSLYIKGEEITIIRGKSGIGKTTLLNCILGINNNYNGEINCPYKNIGVVFQEDRLIEEMSVYGNINLVYKGKLSKEKLENILLEVGLYNVINKKVKNLSGGMKRRVSVVRAIINKPELLVLDEPFKGLDLDSLNITLNKIINYREKPTIIMVLHENINFPDNVKVNYMEIKES